MARLSGFARRPEEDAVDGMPSVGTGEAKSVEAGLVAADGGGGPNLRRAREVHPSALLLILCTATFMAALDLFIVNVGLQDIGRELGEHSLANLSWILNAYAIVFAALLVPAGRLADRYGNKAVFLIGLVLFSGASLFCALSGDIWLIVGLRCLQAVGAAAITPTSLGLILTAIPAARRAHSIQVWAVSGSLGAAAGPALGGLLVQVSWRWIFLINVPIGVATLIAAGLLAPNVKHGNENRVPDLLGGLLLVIASGALALALVQGPDWGWGSPSILGSFAVSLITAGLFVTRSRRHPAPVIDLGLFRHSIFSWANVSMLLVSVGFAAQLLGLVLWLQRGWSWSPLETGLGIAPGPVMVSVTALGLRRFTVGVRPGLIAALGTLLMGLGGVVMALLLTVEPNYLLGVVPGWLIVGAGVGFAMPTIVRAATADLLPQQTSTGSAVVQMSRQIGSVLGVAGLVVILGSPAGPAHLLDRFGVALWGAGLFALLAALAALRLSPRPAGVAAPAGPASSPAP
jgi:EmrB/QacA subfamily drug resistance transporter